MIVQDMMNKKPITAESHTTIKEAFILLRHHHIRHLPIVDSAKQLLGIVSDRDLRDASPSIFDGEDHQAAFERSLSEVMKKDVISAHPLDFVEDTLSTFYDQQIGCLPVVEHGRLVGVITERDMLHTLIQLTGAHQPSSHLEIRVENIAGKLADVANHIKKYKININSVLVYPSNDEEAYKIIVLRINTMNPLRIANDLRAHGYDVLWPQEAELSQ
ncbi:acetoin dehydrogenase [Fictibacillus macauensis ZFHKF-1]|uniref:Acetoin dehydrogenase n=1 Tax=Fictibacillus macauensis ZFHKF-1 TaxID=1196324 RepID=I8AIF2_9BACL|nr:acetoin utilization AcuB family protein [Fictibacillus macauensis]EIT85482.1 acetoin dehydrogenase [Fictibacillus macauensis ZFHKF-1]